ncbi:MAG: DUF1570 domain-containing protein [Thermoguttaceae bacterium]
MTHFTLTHLRFNFSFVLTGIVFFCVSKILCAEIIDQTFPYLAFPKLSDKSISVTKEQKEKGEILFSEAMLTAEKGAGLRAFQLILDVLRCDPNHVQARRIFGYSFENDSWTTDWERERRSRGMIDHPLFGWIPAEHVKRYEDGERFFPKIGWQSEIEAAKRTEKIESGWNIMTEHFDIRTNHSLEEGVRIGRELEHFYRVWQFLAINLVLNDVSTARLIVNRGPIFVRTTRHQVFLYKNKSDYIANLQKTISPEFHSQLHASNGYYDPKRKVSSFFAVSAQMNKIEADSVTRTLFHEAAHQLFQEVKPQKKMPGEKNNFWLVEGIAMFMESFHVTETEYRIGDLLDNRLYAAKMRKNEHGFHVPLAALVQLGSDAFQSHEQLVPLYAESAAMTYFFLVSKNENYRNAVLELLRLIYTNSAKPDSLSVLTARSYSDLNQEYDSFIQTIP